MRKCELNNPSDIKVGKRKGEEVLQALQQSLAVCEDHGGAVPLQFVVDHIGTDLCATACGRPHTRADGYVLKEDAAMESLCWSRLLAGTVA